MMTIPIARRTRRGFSMAEVLAVATILGIISVILVPRVVSSRDTTEEQAHQRNVELINSAVEQFYICESHWPQDDLSDIGVDRNYFPDGVPRNPLNGGPYKLDPTTHRVQ